MDECNCRVKFCVLFCRLISVVQHVFIQKVNMQTAEQIAITVHVTGATSLSRFCWFRYTCQLFLSQRREFFFLPSARVSEDNLTIAEDFRKLPRRFRRISKF